MCNVTKLAAASKVLLCSVLGGGGIWGNDLDSANHDACDIYACRQCFLAVVVFVMCLKVGNHCVMPQFPAS